MESTRETYEARKVFSNVKCLMVKWERRRGRCLRSWTVNGGSAQKFPQNGTICFQIPCWLVGLLAATDMAQFPSSRFTTFLHFVSRAGSGLSRANFFSRNDFMLHTFAKCSRNARKKKPKNHLEVNSFLILSRRHKKVFLVQVGSIFRLPTFFLLQTFVSRSVSRPLPPLSLAFDYCVSRLEIFSFLFPHPYTHGRYLSSAETLQALCRAITLGIYCIPIHEHKSSCESN